MARELFAAVDHTLEPEWQGEFYAHLAGFCERLRLRDRDAQILNLYCRGLPLVAIGEALGIVHYRKALSRCLHRCAEHYARAVRASGNIDDLTYLAQRRWFWVLLECIRNSTNTDWDLQADEPERLSVRRLVVSLDDLAPPPPDVMTLLLAEFGREEEDENDEMRQRGVRMMMGPQGRVWSSG